MVSLALRAGIAVDDIVEQLQGITCCPFWDGGTLVRSGPDAVASVLRQYSQHLENYHAPADRSVLAVSGSRKCPDCNAQANFQEGCLTCQACGWSKCE